MDAFPDELGCDWLSGVVMFGLWKRLKVIGRRVVCQSDLGGRQQINQESQKLVAPTVCPLLQSTSRSNQNPLERTTWLFGRKRIPYDANDVMVLGAVEVYTVRVDYSTPYQMVLPLR